MHEIIAKSNFGTTIQNDSQGVVCAIDTLVVPGGTNADALNCTHVTQMSGAFWQGITADLQAGVPYVFSFYFRNGSFDSPYGNLPPTIGIKRVGPNVSGGAQLNMFFPAENSWYRQKYMFTAANSGTYQIGFMHSLDRPAGGAYWLYGFQLETGNDVTTYIP